MSDGEGSSSAIASRWLFAGLIAAVAVLLGGLALWRDARRETVGSHPLVAGELRLAGPHAELRIVRDKRGVPHVRAQSERDAWFGLGFAQAQDRLGQLVWLRRLALGRSAEVVGREGFASDALVRTLGLAQLADRELARAQPETRRALEGYAAGVNAWLAQLRRGETAPPRALTEAVDAIEPWTPRDSLAIAKHQAFALADPIAEILVLERVVRALGAGPARGLFPAPANTLPAATAWAPSPPVLDAAAVVRLTAARRSASLAGSSVGSTGWILGGDRVRRGRALLAADLHAPPTFPARVYEADLRGGGLEVAGATLPGIPAFWAGFNPEVAWALIATPVVVVDLVEETLYAKDPTRYFDAGKWRELAVREERIAIAGEPERLLRVRSTPRGPLLDELFPEAGRPLALRWTGAQAGGLDELVALAHALDASNAREALRSYGAPVVNALVVDSRGAGLAQLAGWIPRRAMPSGLQPVPAANPSYEWTERLGLDELPFATLTAGRPWLIAADGTLPANANRIETLWRPGGRTARIEELLREHSSRGQIELAELVALQADTGSALARRTVASILQLVGDASIASSERELLDLLRGWDGASGTDSRAAAAYHVLSVRTLPQLLKPALGEPLASAYLALPRVSASRLFADTVASAAAGGESESPWTAPELARAALLRSLRETTLLLAARIEANREKWSWGRLHGVRFAPLWPGAGPADERGLGPFPIGGDADSVAVSEYAAESESFDAVVVPGYRLLVDSANLDQALTALVPGASEHAGHPHALDGIARWLLGKPSLLSTSDPVIEEGDVAVLALEPAR